MIAVAGVDDDIWDLRWWCWPWSSAWLALLSALSERSFPPTYTVHWYCQLLGNFRDLMGFYLNWNCLIYKLIYFLYSKNKPNQTPDYKPRMRISAYINSLLSTTKENESLKKISPRYFNHQNTSRSNIKIQREGILHFLENVLYFYFSSHQNSSEIFSQVVWHF